MPGLGPSAPGKPSRPGKPTLTLGIPALDGEPADELEAELDDDAEELDELDEEGIEGGCDDDRVGVA